MYDHAADPLDALSPRERRVWAENVIAHREALTTGFAEAGPWMVRRAEAILAELR